MKSIILMTTATFLICAPSPDSKTISELSAGFLAPSSETALVAAEVTPKVHTKTKATTLLAVQSENEEIRLVDQLDE